MDWKEARVNGKTIREDVGDLVDKLLIHQYTSSPAQIIP